jgi:Ca-activated chloride channel family protein
MKPFLLTGVVAMTLGALAPAPYAAYAVPRATASPVLCNTGPITRQPVTHVMVTGKRKASVQPRNTPPVPSVAPPPLPVPPVPKEMHQSFMAPPVQMNMSPAYEPNTERYEGKAVAAVSRVADAPVSTFSIDVDTAAYANVRRMLMAGQTPPPAAVRTEEMLNYFRYDYPLPKDRIRPFSVTSTVSDTPWNPETRLIRIGLRAYDVPRSARPPANLVFLIDVSGSMNEENKLPLVKTALGMLADQLRPQDRVSIVVYAGAAGMVLKPTSNGQYVKQALACLAAGGSTAGGAGLDLAYATAKANFIKNGVNRVILATDGDFNVGVTRDQDLLSLVKQKMQGGVTLTALGFGDGNYNDAMMEKIADAGNGNYAYIDSAIEARKVLSDELSSTLVTVASDVKIQVEFNPALISQYRLIGYEDRALNEADFNNDKVDAGDVGAGHQVTALYEVLPADASAKGEGWLTTRHFEANQSGLDGDQAGQAAWLRLRYKLPGETASRLIEQPITAQSLRSAAPPKNDMAFAVAVAAFGQLLRDDPMLGDFDMARVRALAGPQTDYLRSQFIELTRAADVSSARH